MVQSERRPGYHRLQVPYAFPCIPEHKNLWPPPYSGMAPIIRTVLSNLIGEEDAKDIDIISNDVTVHPDGKWGIKYRHPSRYSLVF